MEEKIKKILKGENGITLIALVVTIVILLILAGVSLNLVLSNNGIVNKAKDAKNKTEQAQINTEALNNLSDEIDYATGAKVPPPPKVEEGEKATDNSTIDGKAPSVSNPIIPEGYIPINTDDAKWDSEDGPEYNKGLVITDSLIDGNEFVWVPVADVSTMYTVGEKTLLGTTGDTAVTTPGYSNLRQRTGDAYTITTPGNQLEIREPDLLSTYDTNSQYYKTILGFNTKEEMGEAFVEDYIAMIESVKKYHGFYIGRYELSAKGVKQDKIPSTYTNWYDLYKACANIKSTDKAQTTMIFGCQWDETMSWLKTTVFAEDTSKVDTDSSSWGNYSNSTVTANDGSILKADGTSTKLNTGVTTFTMRNNIYDLAGNCMEWSQEAIITKRSCSSWTVFIAVQALFIQLQTVISPFRAIRASATILLGPHFM